MPRNAHLLLAVLSALAVCLGTSADDPVNVTPGPYQVIVDRNIFQLRTVPLPEPASLTPNQAARPPIFLTGLTSFGGRSAVLKTKRAPKPGEAPQVKYYVIPEGRSQDDIQVLAINEQAGTARLRYAGTEITVDLKDKDQEAAPVPVAPAPGLAGRTVALAASPLPQSPSPNGAAVPFQPQIVPTLPPISSPARSAAETSPADHPWGYDEHGL